MAVVTTKTQVSPTTLKLNISLDGNEVTSYEYKKTNNKITIAALPQVNNDIAGFQQALSDIIFFREMVIKNFQPPQESDQVDVEKRNNGNIWNLKITVQEAVISNIDFDTQTKILTFYPRSEKQMKWLSFETWQDSLIRFCGFVKTL